MNGVAEFAVITALAFITGMMVVFGKRGDRLERQLHAERELRLKFERLAQSYASDADVLRRVLWRVRAK